MKPRICICCGELLGENGDAHSGNPNMCACCSSLWDGMPQSSLSSFDVPDDDELVTAHYRKIVAAGEVILA